MADTTTTQLRILSLVTDDMQLSVPDVATDLIDEGTLDSLVFVDLIARLEETFGFEIDLSDLEIDEFRSVRQIAAYVQTQTGAAGHHGERLASSRVAAGGAGGALTGLAL